MMGFLLLLIFLSSIFILISRWQSQEQRKWWVKIVTKYPACTYYFGPFDTVQEAQGSQLDYSQDLQDEGAQITTIKVQKCQPRQLTICQE